MSIVAVNRYYAPDHSATSQLLTDLAEHLAARGEAVTVIASRLIYDDPARRLPAFEVINGVRVRRVWTSGFGRAHLAGRAIDYLSFYLWAFGAMLAEVRAGDTLIAKTDPPMISVPAAMVARLKGARLVNWCQDLFPEIAAALGMRWARGPVGSLLAAMRNRSLKAARTNVVLCSSMQERLEREGIDPARITIIHNWCDPAIRPVPANRHAHPVIGYSGNLGRAHCPDAILDLIERCADDPELASIRWSFTGGGAGLERLRTSLPARLKDRVSFRPYRPRAELGASLGECDLQLVSLDPACEGLIMPSKFYGILAAGRPVIFLGSSTGAIARLIDELHCGVTLAIAQPETWPRTLTRFLHPPPTPNPGPEPTFTPSQSLGQWTDTLHPTTVPAHPNTRNQGATAQ